MLEWNVAMGFMVDWICVWACVLLSNYVAKYRFSKYVANAVVRMHNIFTVAYFLRFFYVMHFSRHCYPYV